MGEGLHEFVLGVERHATRCHSLKARPSSRRQSIFWIQIEKEKMVQTN
jgi:hypothetical protein